MPIVSFSATDIKRNTLVEPGWYVVKIESVGEKLSADQGSTNYPVEGVVVHSAVDGDTTYSGVPIYWNFNSKAISRAIGFFEAFGVEIKPEEKIDFNAAVGKSLKVMIERGEWKGRQKNEVNDKYASVDA